MRYTLEVYLSANLAGRLLRKDIDESKSEKAGVIASICGQMFVVILVAFEWLLRKGSVPGPTTYHIQWYRRFYVSKAPAG